MTDTTQTTEADGSGAEAASAVSLNSRRTNPNFQRILESKWFLNSEEKGQYEQDLEALVEKLNPQSFLAWKDIEDYADKLQGERRYKPVIAAVINAKLARRKNWTVDPEREKREAKAVQEYLPSVIKLARLVDNSFDTRKRLEKDFRRRARARQNGAAPSIMPEDNIDE
jgi:hypothetical protein